MHDILYEFNNNADSTNKTREASFLFQCIFITAASVAIDRLLRLIFRNFTTPCLAVTGGVILAGAANYASWTGFPLRTIIILFVIPVFYLLAFLVYLFLSLYDGE